MNFDKNTGKFVPQIAGVITGVTKQVSGLNGILQNFQDNDNNLMAVKLGGINDPVISSNLDKNATTLAQFSSSNANVAPIIEGSQHFVLQQSTGAGYGSQIATNYGATPRMALRSYSPTAYSSWAEVYTTSHKPSKADVGLGNVPNYGASSAINSTRNDQLATSGAVKQSYDRGTDGINRANTAQAKANSAYSYADSNLLEIRKKLSSHDPVATGNLYIAPADGTVTHSVQLFCRTNNNLEIQADAIQMTNGDLNIMNGDLVVGGKVLGTSDINLKENISQEEDALTKISKLNGYSYNFKADEEKKLFSGVIAQEVEKEYSHIVTTNEETGMKSVAYTELIAPMIEAIKELKDMNEKLANRVLELENK